MQFCKWCRFLMRTMSPLVVGLICVLLIEVSSALSSAIHSHYFQVEHSAHPIISSGSALKKHVVLPSIAKDHKFRRTKFITVSPSTVEKNFTSSTSNFSKTLPNLNLRSKFRVRNGTEVNTTVIFSPRYSRAMANFSKTRVNKDLQPIIVSSHRRELLEARDFGLRSGLDAKYITEDNISTQLTSHSRGRELSKNVAPLKPTKKYLIFRKPFSLTKTEASNSQQTPDNLFKRKSVVQAPSKSTDFIKIKNNDINSAYIKNNSTISHISSIMKPRNHSNRKILQKNRRQGRTFDLRDDQNFNEKRAGSSGVILIHPIANKPKDSSFKNNIKVSEKLFNYTYIPISPRQSISVQNKESVEGINDSSAEIASSILIPLINLGTSYSEKKAKNLTIYEILKPRLKNETFTFEAVINNSTLWPKYDYEVDAESKYENRTLQIENTSLNKILGNENVDNATLITNAIQYETPPIPNSMVIMPSRSDSSYGVEYVMVNRNNSVVVSPVNVNKTDSSQITEFGRRHYNNSRANSLRRIKNINPDTDNMHFQNRQNETDISIYKDLLRLRPLEFSNITNHLNKNATSSTDYILEEESEHPDNSKYTSELFVTDTYRKPKMTETTNANNAPFKNPKLDSKMFYDYFAKRPIGNVTLREFPYPEFRPGNMFRYSDIYQRKPILERPYTSSTPRLKLHRTEDLVTEESILSPTTFNSLKTSVRVKSTFYPNRMQDVTMKFGNRIETSTTPAHSDDDVNLELHKDDDFEDSEYRDALDPGFTMEKLAYILIGTCCGLSILCLFVVVIAIKCRRVMVEKRMKAEFRKRMYYHEKMKDIATPWQQQMFDHFMYLHRRPVNSSCSSGTNSCNCRCITWSLGARNLDATRPLCSTNRSSLCLLGQKRLPFGAASTLRYESMLGHKRTSPDTRQQKAESPNTDSSHENDSLDIDSDSREGDGSKQCTCIDYNVWPMGPSNVPHGFFTMCPNPRRYNVGNCSQHPPVELRTISRSIPPPVTGSNYLDRSEGVVYWSSNEERLI